MESKPGTEELARRIISHHFGGDPFRLKKEGGGLNNEVVTAQHSAGDFIVRIRPNDSEVDIFQKEKWATVKARESGVPAPEVLIVGAEAIPNAYMIARNSAGEPASKHGDRLSIVRELGHYAAIINSIPTEGFGSTFDWAGENRPRYRNWKDFLDKELKLDEKLEVLEATRMLDAAGRQKVRTMLEAAQSAASRQRLNHGDLRMKNLLVEKDGRISAILDWEQCTSNITPHWEFALALHDLNIDEKQAFLAGYELPLKRYGRSRR